MGQKRVRGRPVDGIVLLDKPAGQTSNRVLQTVKRLFQAQKAGHTGSLDPFATGMLPLCLGSATKVSSYLLAASKEYAVRVEFGRATDTGDIDGAVIDEILTEPVAVGDVTAALDAFIGDSTQIPPMYSALKHEGRRLYDLARRGIEVERAPRAVRIDWIRLERVAWPTVEFSVRCSKGTYIRALAVDIAARLGTLGHVTALRRIAVDPFDPAAMWTLESLQAAAEEGLEALDRCLLATDVALPHLDEVHLPAADVDSLVHGRSIAVMTGEAGMLRIYGPDRRFVGLGERDDDGRLQPRRIFLV